MAAPMQGMPMQPQPGIPPPQQSDPKLDNIGKVKSLLWPLKDSLANTMKLAAQNIYQNATVDAGLKTTDSPIPRFDKSLEEFYAICDQIELHLKTTLESSNITSCSKRYTPIPLIKQEQAGPGSGPDNLSYNQYLNTVRTQIGYAKEIHDALSVAARNITSNEN